MKTILLTLLLTVLAATACIKPKHDAVLLRMRNITFNNFKYSSSSGEAFGTINAGAVTDYKAFDKVVAYPNAHFVISTDTIYTAGSFICGTPPIPYLEKGRYTVEVFADSTSFTGYEARFTKD